MSLSGSTPTKIDNPFNESVDRHVGSRVRAARENLGLDVQELADAIGRDRGYVLWMEDGTISIPARTLFDLSTTLNVHVGTFFDDN